MNLHDTSSDSLSKWRTVGAQKSQPSILSSASKVQSKKFKPGKDRQQSKSKLFDRNKSRIDSFDNASKQDIQDTSSRDHNEGIRNRGIVKSASIDAPLIRVSSATLNQMRQIQPKEGGITNRTSKITNFSKQKQLILLKEDYAKFKQKILSQLQIQKQNITKMVNQILNSVKDQLAAIQQKYARNVTLRTAEFTLPSFKNINAASVNPTSIGKIPDISTITNINQIQVSKTPTQKALIEELKSIKNVDNDQITERFSKFYSAIQKLKTDLDTLHQISVTNTPQEHPMILPLQSPANGGRSNPNPLKNMSPFFKSQQSH